MVSVTTFVKRGSTTLTCAILANRTTIYSNRSLAFESNRPLCLKMLSKVTAFRPSLTSNSITSPPQLPRRLSEPAAAISPASYISTRAQKDGLKPDQAVITPDGIVGKIRDVFPNNTSQVLLINDQTSGAGVLLASTRLRAILRGSPTGQIMINNLTPDSRIKVGEQVLTSGGDLVYPRGLPVGTIESIKARPRSSALHPYSASSCGQPKSARGGPRH